MDTQDQDTLTPAHRQTIQAALRLGKIMALQTVTEAVAAARPYGDAAMVQAVLAIVAQSLAPSPLETTGPEVRH